MNELLLTPEEIKAIPLPEVEININDTGWCIPYCNVIAQAQLDKILKPEWKDKPDSEGWWWQKTEDNIQCFNLLTGMGCHLPSYMEYKSQNGGIDSIKIRGKWTKAVVPEMEE